MQDVAEALRQIGDALGALNEADRRHVALMVFRRYGGPLSDVERAAISRVRHAARDNPVTARVTNVSHGVSPDPSSYSQAREIQESLPVVPVVGSSSKDSANGSSSKGKEPEVRFQIPESILRALERAEILGKVATLRSESFWRAEVRANHGVNFAGELMKAEAWLTANRERAPHKNFGRFIHTWLGRAERGEA